MSEELIVRHCAPTLAGIKTANLFTCDYKTIEETERIVSNLNKSLAKKGVRVATLRYSDNRVLIYIYRPKRLEKDWSNQCVYALLSEKGYQCENIDRCVAQLSKEITYSQMFPHEIGLFLGYPPEDVKGFIENKGAGYKCIGCWKVYGDEQHARKLFDIYKKCTEVYCARYLRGVSMQQLTVAA